jgi:thiol-disulfide isomerase/thioredoxin
MPLITRSAESPDGRDGQAVATHVDQHAAGMPLVVQFGSERCALCPQATLDIDKAKKAYEFRWTYEDAPTSALAEELGVAALPAVLVFHDKANYVLYQKLRGDEVTGVIKEHCKPWLVLDEEF